MKFMFPNISSNIWFENKIITLRLFFFVFLLTEHIHVHVLLKLIQKLSSLEHLVSWVIIAIKEQIFSTWKCLTMCLFKYFLPKSTCIYHYGGKSEQSMYRYDKLLSKVS